MKKLVPPQGNLLDHVLILEGFHDDRDILQGGLVTLANVQNPDGSPVTVDLPQILVDNKKLNEIGRWFHLGIVFDDGLKYYFNGNRTDIGIPKEPRSLEKPFRVEQLCFK